MAFKRARSSAVWWYGVIRSCTPLTDIRRMAGLSVMAEARSGMVSGRQGLLEKLCLGLRVVGVGAKFLVFDVVGAQRVAVHEQGARAV